MGAHWTMKMFACAVGTGKWDWRSGTKWNLGNQKGFIWSLKRYAMHWSILSIVSPKERKRKEKRKTLKKNKEKNHTKQMWVPRLPLNVPSRWKTTTKKLWHPHIILVHKSLLYFLKTPWPSLGFDSMKFSNFFSFKFILHLGSFQFSQRNFPAFSPGWPTTEPDCLLHHKDLEVASLPFILWEKSWTKRIQWVSAGLKHGILIPYHYRSPLQNAVTQELFRNTDPRDPCLRFPLKSSGFKKP